MQSELARTIGSNIKQLLDENHMMQKELAVILDVSESSIGKWILGHNMPRMGCIQKMSDFFHVRKSQLLGEAPLGTSEWRTIPILRDLPSNETIRTGDIKDYLTVPSSWNLSFACPAPQGFPSASGTAELLLCRKDTQTLDGDWVIGRIGNADPIVCQLGSKQDPTSPSERLRIAAQIVQVISRL